VGSIKPVDIHSGGEAKWRLVFEVFTLFPGVFKPYLEASILQKARERGFVKVNLHNIRDWTSDRHHVTDDVPYGGGGGMVMKPEPIFAAVEGVLGNRVECPLILLTPQGRLFTQSVAEELVIKAGQGSQLDVDNLEERQLGLICGRYEGVDERVRIYLASDELSIGDYVLTGGELGAMVVIDALVRLIPGVLGDPQATAKDSHSSGLLEHPQYTRPAEFRGWQVPDVLLSGDHARIGEWRRQQALRRTLERRPELLDTAQLTESDFQFLKKIRGSELP
jgi:tRNA (guanine37-N1)-methyltransferase